MKISWLEAGPVFSCEQWFNIGNPPRDLLEQNYLE